MNLVKRLSPGVIGVITKEGRQLWTLARLRKDTKCCSCGGGIEKGAYGWSPMTNQGNRMDRMCVKCEKKMKAEKTSPHDPVPA